MKEYFLVRKTIDDLRIDGEWQDVSLEAIREAASLNDIKEVDLYLTREDAEAAALDDADFENDTDFFPVIRVEVPNKLKGRATEVELEDGSVLQTRTFNTKNIRPTDVYLSHIDESYSDVKLAKSPIKQAAAKSKVEIFDEAKVAAPAVVKASRFNIGGLRRFVPSPTLTNAKHALGLTAIGLAWYFGNGQVADVVAKTGYALPEMVATNPVLPVGVGIIARTVAEAPELFIKGVVKAGTGIAGLCKAGKAKWDARKAPRPAVTAPNAGSARISQLAARLEQSEDSSASAEISTSKVQVSAFAKETAGSAALRELIPTKAVTPAVVPAKQTIH